ncbi:hypothetical protein PP586_gp60 [Pseudoalteromonas phage vB_PspS-H40/1]|uniref:hypothetical protein n=1 Tax=Pseudoalteromonas phage vB_PspS-H40/1 TaxID=1856120 RepID=UPI0007DD7CCA|nr:hypothetical protein PP586_gp60 [Pseudoalteromonas phage vB_PspS-H40/1]ANI22077.1 hypothetical protein H401_60 [Pseudoalteromonas phage vB_PspS-H40/1]
MSDWISVNDELPEPYTTVLRFPSYEIEYGSEYTAHYDSVDNKFHVDCEDSFATWECVAEVTHWMPLPAPPK